MAHGKVGIVEGYALANVDSVEIVVKGVGGHGSMPHLCKDPIVLAAQINYLKNYKNLNSPLSVLLLNTLQIKPEERLLRQRFGDAYARYAARVRRWL